MELLKTFNPDNVITFTESATEHLVSQVKASEDGYKEHMIGPYLFLLDEKSEDFLAGSEVDLVNEGLKGKTLVVKSPKASGECGCGESVTFDV